MSLMNRVKSIYILIKIGFHSRAVHNRFHSHFEISGFHNQKQIFNAKVAVKSVLENLP